MTTGFMVGTLGVVSGMLVLLGPGVERKAAVAGRASLLVGMLFVVVAWAGVALAHAPNNAGYDYTCATGEGEEHYSGLCYKHHTNANAKWEFSSGFPSAYELNVKYGASRWDKTYGHQFDYILDTGAGDYTDVVWTSSPSCSSAAIGCVTLKYSGDHILEGITGMYFRSTTNWYNGVGTPGSGQYDLRSVATHEFGHLLGLGHSATQTATMVSGIDPGTTFKRTLHPDDRLGRCEVYGHSHSYWGGC